MWKFWGGPTESKLGNVETTAARPASFWARDLFGLRAKCWWPPTETGGICACHGISSDIDGICFCTSPPRSSCYEFCWGQPPAPVAILHLKMSGSHCGRKQISKMRSSSAGSFLNLSSLYLEFARSLSWPLGTRYAWQPQWKSRWVPVISIVCNNTFHGNRNTVIHHLINGYTATTASVISQLLSLQPWFTPI